MPAHGGMRCVRPLINRKAEMAKERFDTGSVFDIFQDISETAELLLQSFAGGFASDQLGLCRSEYIEAVEGGVPSVNRNELPEYTGHPFDIVEGNFPFFSKDDRAVEVGHECYSELDEIGRCGAALALVSKETMPEDGEPRRTIKQVIPSGWHDVEYDFIEGKKLYNRCHLIGYRLTGEHANERNLITGTRYMNHAMRVFENMVADHCEQHGDARVLYRVTPIYWDDELVARGAQMEALSICEDDAPLRFNVYLHNIQPGVRIDYATGDSCRDDSVRDSMVRDCVVNDKTKVLHRKNCPSTRDLQTSAYRTYTGMRDELLNNGYTACRRCKP